MDAVLRTATNYLPYSIQAVFREAWSAVCYALAPPLLPAKPINGGRLIVLIPGSHGSPNYLADLADHLKQFGTVRTFSYTPHSMEDGLEQLKKVLKGATEVDLVGHSQGAMIACHYAYVGEPTVKVNRVISLAGRLEPVGWFTWPYQDLIPYLKQISAADKPTLTTLVASHDWLVPYSKGTYTIWGASHLSIVSHEKTWEILANLLKTND